MNKLVKPHFQFSTIDKVSSVFGIIIGIFGYISFPWYIPTIILSLLFIVLLGFNFYKYKNQVDSLYTEYNNTYENHLALSKQFKFKSKQISEQNDLLYQYDFILNNIINIVTLKIVNTSEIENEFLSNLNKILLQDKEYLYQLKRGDNKNE